MIERAITFREHVSRKARGLARRFRDSIYDLALEGGVTRIENEYFAGKISRQGVIEKRDSIELSGRYRRGDFFIAVNAKIGIQQSSEML